MAGTSYTIRNIGFAANTFAYSTGQETAPVTGNSLVTEWAIIPNSGIYSYVFAPWFHECMVDMVDRIMYGNDTSKAFYVAPNDQVGDNAYSFGLNAG